MNILLNLFKGLFNMTKNNLEKVIYFKHYRFYPTNPKHDDIYIVEFPKSGITWLSTIIANINLLESNEKIKITFYNLQQYIPDIHSTRTINYFPLWSFPKFRFIKSHDTYNKNYKHVIYLVRDPIKVMNSYFIFAKELKIFNGTIDDFVKHPLFGIKSWIDHIESWLNKGVTDQKIHLIKYEDLLENPFIELKKIYQNLGLDVSDDNIHKSIDLSDLNQMKISENTHKNNNPNYKNFYFIGNGKNLLETNMTNNIKTYIFKNIKHSKIYKDIYENEFSKFKDMV